MTQDGTIDERRKQRVLAIKEELLADPLLMGAVGLSVVIHGIKKNQAQSAEVGWLPLMKPDKMVAVDEAETYLFAIEVLHNGEARWEYFVDAVVWDAETDPEWHSGEHGFDLDDVIFFKPLKPPTGKEKHPE